MKNHKIIFALTSVLTLISFQACQKSDISNLQEAQLCLNTATSTTAKACVSSIASNTTAYADSLRCSAIFISEGFGAPSSFLSAIESINTAGNCAGGCSSTVNALNVFRFKSADVATSVGRTTNSATAAEAFSVCSASKVKFYAQISSLFKIGTLAAMIAYVGNSNPSQTDIETAIASLDALVLGDLVITTSAAVCADTLNASAATKAYCKELATALASPAGTATSIGNCLKAKLADPAAICT